MGGLGEGEGGREFVHYFLNLGFRVSVLCHAGQEIVHVPVVHLEDHQFGAEFRVLGFGLWV